MSFRKLVPIVAILAVFAMAFRFSIGPDTYWHLRTGDWILSEGRLPQLDPFSLTQFGSEWIYPGWLAQIAMISVFRLLGFPGLNLLTAVTVALAFVFVWKTTTGNPLLRAFVLLLAATVSAVYWSSRPHIFTFLFTAITLWALARFRRDSGSRAIWLIPILTIVWANVHGGFVIPVLLIGLEVAACALFLLLRRLRIANSAQGGDGEPERADRRDELVGEREQILGRLKTLLLLGIATVAAIVVNPFGVEMLAYPFRTISIGVLQDYIQEWQSPDFHQIEVQPFLWMLILVLAAMAISPKRPTAIELIHVGVFAYLGFLAVRNIALFALVAAPVLSRHLDASFTRWIPKRTEREQLPPRLTRPLNALLLLLIGTVVLVKIALPLSSEFNDETIAENMPAEAVDYLSVNQPDGPLFNTYNWGGYVLWRLYPEYLSFVDGRTDLFDDAILEEYLDVWRGEDGWRGTLEEWNIQIILIEKDAPLVRELAREGWTIEYEDEQASVLSGPN